MLSGKTLKDVIEILQEDLKIVFLDSETLGKDVDLSKLNKYGAVTVYDQSLKEEIKERIKDASVVINIS